MVTSTVPVRDRGLPVTRLNELELVDGQILANVWQTPWIARIDPRSSEVTGWIDGSPLMEEIGSTDPEAVLNGIAVDAGSGRLWLTGKLWPTIFEVQVLPATDLPPPGVGAEPRGSGPSTLTPGQVQPHAGCGRQLRRRGIPSGRRISTVPSAVVGTKPSRCASAC